MAVTNTYGFQAISPPTRVNTTTTGNQWDPVVVGIDSNTAVVFFADESVAGGRLLAQRIDRNGNLIGGEVVVATGVDTNFEKGFAATKLTNGNIAVTWSDNAATPDLFFRLYNSSMTALGAATSADGTSAKSLHPSIVASANGGFIIAWHKDFGTDGDVGFRRFDSAGATTDPSTGIVIDSTSTFDDRNPAVAVLSDGKIAIAFERVNGANVEMWHAVYNANGTVFKAAELVDATGSINVKPDIVARADGGYIIFYQDNGWGVATTEVTGWKFSSTGVDQGFTRVSNDQSFPNLMVDAAVSAGGYIVSTSTTEGPYNTVATLLSASGTALVRDIDLSPAAGVSGFGSVTWLDSSTIMVADIALSGAPGTDASAYSTVGKTFSVTHTSIGDGAGDVITGDGLLDIILSGGGNDALTGAGANDIIDGGTGVDTANFSGPRFNYLVSKDGGTYKVTDFRGGSPDGTDTIANVERFTFQSSVVSTETFTPNNMNGDLKSDLVWFNNATGQAVTFLMNGTTIASATAIGAANGANVDLKAVADLNGDGQSDLIWQDTAGNVIGFIMNGTSIASAAVIANPGAAFKVVGTGDLNADGNVDIVVQDANGQAVGFLMNGTALQSAAAIGGANGTQWSVKGMGDLNGDGKSDLVWGSTAGEATVFLMNGTTIASAAVIAGPQGANFSIKAVGGINDDFSADIIWQYSNGQAGAWLMNGASIAGAGAIGGANGSQFEVKDLADINGDGRLDLIWENNSNGSAVGFLLNGTSILGAAAIGGANGTDWLIV